MTRELLIKHLKTHPELEIQDVFKFLYQSAFGCEHLVSSLEKAIEYIEKEYESAKPSEAEIDPLDGEYVRVPLSVINKGITPSTLGKLFFLSAKHNENAEISLIEKLKVMSELVKEGLLPFSEAEFDQALSEWKEAGYPPIHHSEKFREAYKPSYRVIAKKYIAFLPVLERLDNLMRKKERIAVAIEGGSASGKTTLGEILSEIYDCTVFHTDDFFLPPEKRTPERFKEIGGNVDYERFEKEVLLPLSMGETINYKPFDCSTMSFSEGNKIHPTSLVIVEGAYSMHPTLEKYYGLKVLLAISPEKQKERILRRNSPSFAHRFFNEWIPLENIYFEKTGIKKRVDLIIEIK